MSASGGRGILYEAIYHASASGAVDRTAQDKLGEVLSVKDFGAKGDGLSDDTNAFQQAITTALATGASVYIPGSTTPYVVSAKITCGSVIRIFGEGRFSVIRPTITNGDPVLYFPPQSTYFSLYNFSIIANINSTNFAAGTAPAQQCTGLYVDSDSGNSLYSSRFNIHNLNCTGMKVGIDIHGFTADVFNTWCQFNEIGFRGDIMNSSELKLRLEDNRQDLVLTNSFAVLFTQLLIEGDNALPVSSTIDGCTNVVLDVPYFEQAAPARNVPFLTVGGSAAVSDFKIISGRVVGSSGLTTGTYPIALDQVTDADVNVHVEDGAQQRNVSATANTKDYRLSGTTAFGRLQDGSNQIGPCFNFWPNRRFDLWFRGWDPASGGFSATRCTTTQETTIVRKGANALKITCTAAQSQNHCDFTIKNDVVTALRGKTVRVGVWMWVPNISAYDESNRVLFPAVVLTSNDGSTTSSSTGTTTTCVRNAWNFLTETVTMQAAATSLIVTLYPNHGNTNAGGTEFVVVDSITVTEDSTPVSRQMNDDLIDSPLIPSIGMGGRLIINSQNAPADTGQTYVVGDICFRSNSGVSAQMGWMCTTAGSPGTWTKMPTLGASVPPQATLTYGTTIASDAALGNSFLVTVTNGTAFAMSNPSSLGGSQAGQTLIYMFKNTSGGATGVITWGANFHLNGGATGFTAGATGTNRSIAFLWDGAVLQEIWRGTLDIPN